MNPSSLPVTRLGYTYLRLKDNHMEILNKDDEIERLVVAATQRCLSLETVKTSENGCVGAQEDFWQRNVIKVLPVESLCGSQCSVHHSQQPPVNRELF